jgi:hypothetical protein
MTTQNPPCELVRDWLVHPMYLCRIPYRIADEFAPTEGMHALNTLLFLLRNQIHPFLF